MTDALKVQEYFLENKLHTCVIGVPASIDFEIQHPVIEGNFNINLSINWF
jgi:hypothetical protein